MITAKASKTLNMVRRNCCRSSPKIKKQAYTTLVKPKTEYAASCWDPYENCHIHKLEKIETVAARDIKHYYKRTSSATEIKKEQKLLAIQERRYIARNIQFYKALK
jgi:hypothetical protein